MPHLICVWSNFWENCKRQMCVTLEALVRVMILWSLFTSMNLLPRSRKSIKAENWRFCVVTATFTDTKSMSKFWHDLVSHISHSDLPWKVILKTKGLLMKLFFFFFNATLTVQLLKPPFFHTLYTLNGSKYASFTRQRGLYSRGWETLLNQGHSIY